MIKTDNKKSTPTLRLIAEKAGISLETVSHILNGTTNKKYSPITREKVKQIALSMGYTPHRASQTMRKGRSNLIAVIHFGSRYRTGQEAVRYLPLAISNHKYDYLVNDLQWHGNSPDRVISDLIEHRVEGVILLANVSNILTKDHIQRFSNSGIPVVSLYGDDQLTMIPLICGDIEDRTFRLTNHLMEIGHRHIMIQVPISKALTNNRNRKERIQGFSRAIETRGIVKSYTADEFFSSPTPTLPPSPTVTGTILQVDYTRYQGDVTRLHYDIVMELHKRKKLPNALLCSNDQGAFGVFTAALEVGLHIPKDLAIVGVDNDPFGEYPAFQLTTVQPDTTGACDAAVSVLLDLIKGKSEMTNIKKIFGSQLIVRASCGIQSITTVSQPDAFVCSQGSVHHDRLRSEAMLACHAHTFPNSWEEWQESIGKLRQTLREKFHIEQQALPPALEVHGQIELEKYRIQRISFLSAPDIRVTGNLYIPNGSGPFPAVLNLHGHWKQGKVAPAVQARGHVLAQHGIAVLSIDAAGAGERGGKERVWEYHGGSKAGELLLAGDSLMGFQVRDNIRALDVLESLPFIRSDKIGVTGASGGGNQTTWLAALDERVKAIVPVASAGSFEAYVARRNCMCETLPGGLLLAEQWHLFGAMAPRALLILNARYDQPAFGCEPFRDTCSRVREIYALAGASENFDGRILDMEHGYKPVALEAMLGWMKYWLTDTPASTPVQLPKWQALPEEQLLCYPKGQRPETCSYTANRKTIAKSLKPFANAGERTALARLIGWQEPSSIPHKDIQIKAIANESWRIDVLSPRDIPLSVICSENPTAGPNQIRLLLSPDGKKSSFVQDQWQKAIDTNTLAVSVDLADTGSLVWDSSLKPGTHFHDSARACLWLGYTLVGEWAESILMICDLLSRITLGIRIQIVAEREMALAALLALALQPRENITLEEHHCPQSLHSLNHDSLAWYIPGFLRWGDLDILRSLASSPANTVY